MDVIKLSPVMQCLYCYTGGVRRLATHTADGNSLCDYHFKVALKERKEEDGRTA